MILTKMTKQRKVTQEYCLYSNTLYENKDDRGKKAEEKMSIFEHTEKKKWKYLFFLSPGEKRSIFEHTEKKVKIFEQTEKKVKIFVFSSGGKKIFEHTEKKSENIFFSLTSSLPLSPSLGKKSVGSLENISIYLF